MGQSRTRVVGLALCGLGLVMVSLSISCDSVSEGGSASSGSTSTDSSSAQSSQADEGQGDPQGADTEGALIGAFQVSLVPPAPATATTNERPGYTSVFGKVFDGESPSLVIWEEATQSGACRLFTPRIPFCTQPCTGGDVCVEDDVCASYPSVVEVGTVEVEGLKTASGATMFPMDPIAGNYQPAGGVVLDYPAFSEGDGITFAAAGSNEAPTFSIEATGIAPLEITSDTIQLDDGESAILTWTPPGQPQIATVHVDLDISHHGGSRGKIECEAEDTGSLELPAALLDELKSLGVSGFPTIVVRRESRGSASSSVGQVDLIIESAIEQEVVIPGLVSCFEDDDCPEEAQTCRFDKVCVEE